MPTYNRLSTMLARPLGEMIHVLTWVYILASPLLFMAYGEHVNWHRFFMRSLLPLSLCVVFYLNYLWLVPRLLQRGRTYSFLCYNLGLVVLVVGFHFFVGMWLTPSLPPPRRPGPPHWFHTLNGILMSVFTILVATALRLSRQWAKSEEARREAELGRTAAELQNLRNQINPHFLLNTLNNIYALTAFDAGRAQFAIQELSRMLRYVLYENREETVSLKKEVGFLQNYIELMRLRLPARVDVRTEFDLPDDGISQICPLLFISLVENAFKHGVSPTAPSFILISLKADRTTVCFSVVNSNHPAKGVGGGSGIGLEQVRRRLELAYPGKYSWEYGPDATGATYRSTLVIRP